MQLLIVSPEPNAASFLASRLSANFACQCASDADEAIEQLQFAPADAIVFTAVPHPVGAVRRIRQIKIRTPIVVLNPEGLDQAIDALDAGADDAVAFQSDPREVRARLMACIRRSAGHSTSVVKTGELVVDLAAHKAMVNGQRVGLTGKEYGCVELLSLRKGKLVKREAFMAHLYGCADNAPDSVSLINVYLSKVRKKFRDIHGPAGKYIHSEWGGGYRLVDPVLPSPMAEE